MRMTSIAIALMLGTAPAFAQTAVDPARADAAAKAAFPNAPAEWQPRLVPDETMQQCSAHRNNPPKAIADAIREREKATIVYPADGKLLGDWKKGEALAQSGYGLRFTDYPATRRERRQLLCVPPADAAGGELRDRRAEPDGVRKAARL